MRTERDSSHDRRAELFDALLETRLRTLGTRAPVCSAPGCGERHPFALTGVYPEIHCREHDADRASRSWLEQHHPPGKSNGPDTVATPANDHAVLSANQRLWPRETLRNPDGSPLLRAAAAVRGWADVLRLILERTIGWVPSFLEQLDDLLRQRLGELWWQEIGDFS
jgi:hypothetical protein